MIQSLTKLCVPLSHEDIFYIIGTKRICSVFKSSEGNSRPKIVPMTEQRGACLEEEMEL